SPSGTGSNGSNTFDYAGGQGGMVISSLDLAGITDATLAFESGIDPNSLSVSGDSNGDLTLSLDANDKVVLQGALSQNAANYGIQAISFADGTTLSYAQLLEMADTGSSTNTSLYGDTGANVFDSKGFATYEQGNGGDDMFLFNPGYGAQRINEIDDAASPGNVISLGSGIAPTDVTVTAGGADNRDVLLTIGTSGDSIDLLNMRVAQQFGIQAVDFPDGTVWTRDQVVSWADATAPASGLPDPSMAALTQAMGSFAPPPPLPPPSSLTGSTVPDIALAPPH
ncbi:MAG: calcium-binding protein, partial [Nevskiales bacterium]